MSAFRFECVDLSVVEEAERAEAASDKHGVKAMVKRRGPKVTRASGIGMV